MFSPSHNTAADTRGSFDVSHWDLEAFSKGGPLFNAFLSFAFPPLGAKVSQLSVATSKDAPHKRGSVWPLPTK